MAHSFVFYCPQDVCPDPLALMIEREYVQFFTWHVVCDNKGLAVVGYVQFVFKRTAESLNGNFPMVKFMESVNDPEIYSKFVNPLTCVDRPVTYGNPRPKTEVKKVVNSIKKKAKEALKKYAPSRRAIIMASLALLMGEPRVL